MTDEIVKEKIRRACLSGPPSVTGEATVAEMDADGKMIVLRKGTNQWVCFPGNENIIGDVPMSLDPMGMQWHTDLRARKPKPTNPTPGLIYMLSGATQRSYTDPFDTTSPAIPIGPHWMIIWPFDAKDAGLGTIMRDAGAMVMFAGTPWAHLHICGSPWEGSEYQIGDRVIRTLTYGLRATIVAVFPRSRWFRLVGKGKVSANDASVNSNCHRHESPDVTLAYLKGKDAESEEAQEHANSSSLALYA